MHLVQFLNLPPEHSISADDGYSLTKDLATKTIDDIPAKARAMVSDYLALALSLNFIDKSTEIKLDTLLIELRKHEVN